MADLPPPDVLGLSKQITMSLHRLRQAETSTLGQRKAARHPVITLLELGFI